MRRPPAVLAVATGMCLLSACSPIVQGSPAIGLDAGGRLIGAVQPCTVDVTVAHLRADGADDDLVTWERSSAEEGPQVWLLTQGRSLAWSRSGELPDLDPATTYEFWVSADDDQERTDRLSVTGAEIAALTAGQVLVPPDWSGQGAEPPAAVLSLGDLADLPC